MEHRLEVADVFRQHEQEFLQRWGATLSPHQRKALLAIRNPRVMYNILFQAASEALLTLGADPRRIGAQLGFLAVLHTWDQQLRAHPHLHCLVPAGGIAPDRSRWVRTR